MRVAVVGGTGPFGTALARRLRDAAGYEVVVGSREAQRAAAVAAQIGVEGAANEDAVRGADLVVLATKADAVIDTARGLRDAIGTTPVLSVASELRVTPEGVFPCTDATALAERIQAELDAPVVAGLHTLAASSLGGDEAPGGRATTREVPPSCPRGPVRSARATRRSRRRDRSSNARWCASRRRPGYPRGRCLRRRTARRWTASGPGRAA